MNMNHTFNKTYDTILPAGEYFVGDVCYFLQDSVMKEVWSNMFNNSDGCFVRDDGYKFIITKPFAGNGFYTGSNKFIYDVDDDNLGIVPVIMGDYSKFTGCGTFHKFNKPVSVFISEHGVISIKSDKWNLDIDTTDAGSIDTDDTGYDSWS
jgi:hypothetical protein